MNRFVSHRSVFIIALVWVVAILLFADAANLDDLCSGTLVLHDDDEVTAPVSIGLSSWADHGGPNRSASLPLSHGEGSASKQQPATPVRVIVDQDSPSLAADWHLGAIFESINAADRVIALRVNPPVRDELFLRFCTLLI